MKFKPAYLILPLLMVAAYFLLLYVFPKYTGMYLFMIILFLGDLYLWSSLRKKVFSYQAWLKILVTLIYWLPMLMLLGMMLSALFISYIDWNDVFKTYWLGFILVFYMAKVLPIIFLLLADTIRVIERVFVLTKKTGREMVQEQRKAITRSRFLQYLGYLSGGLVLGTMFVGMFKWVYEFRVAKQTIKLPHLPADFDGLKLVQISDMHLGSWTLRKALQQAVDLINEMNPDIVLFTGDLVNYATKEAFRFEEILKNISASKGVFAILGNHDYGDYVHWSSDEAKQENMEQLYAFYDRIGWKLLSNGNHIFQSPSGKLALLGVENWGANPRFPRLGNIDKALAGTEDIPTKILMTHDPTHWEKIIIPQSYDIALSLSGHTHGFQFGIEIPGIKWSPAKWMYKYWAGLYRDDTSGNYLYVNRGIGSIGYPGRIGILPEITLIELIKA
ncbi:MAG: metallophosphoesterase [Bacteroidales bacterium]|nr:metallophosphoesterase [Bacteroidales bacterium]MCF6341851.1 metallophosphoesterase [Bacteroidales bacterium]